MNHANSDAPSSAPSPLTPFFPVTNEFANFSLLRCPPSALPRVGAPIVEYAHWATLRHWIIKLRDLYCPPTSYDAATRSSHALLVAPAFLGYEAVALGRKKDFSPLIACETNKEWVEAAYHNIKPYKLPWVSLKDYSLFTLIRDKFNVSCPGAALYWDLTRSPHDNIYINMNEQHDNYIFTPPIDNQYNTLSEYIHYIFHHTSCRIIILRCALEFHSELIQAMAVHGEENIKITPHVKWVALCGRKAGAQPAQPASAASSAISSANPSSSSLASSSATATAASASPTAAAASVPPSIPASAHIDVYRDPTVIPSSSRYQLVYLSRCQERHADHHLFQRIKQILNSQLYNCPKAQEMLWREFLRLTRNPISVLENNSSSSTATAASAHQYTVRAPTLSEFLSTCVGYYDDESIYDRLRAFYHHTVLATPEVVAQRGHGEGGGRANSRVTEIQAILRSAPHNPPIHNILDVGCSEGAITAALGHALGLQRPAIHGVDVREIPSKEFTFHLVVDERLPFPAESFDCVMALMALHHIVDVQLSLSEIHRVLKPGGLFLLREHDHYCPRLPVLLDVMHGLYARVWANPPEQPQFCCSYYAHYRDRREWNKLIATSGLIQCANSPDHERIYKGNVDVQRYRQGQFIKNPFAFYYGLYQKPLATQSQPQSAAHDEGRAADGDGEGGAKRQRVA